MAGIGESSRVADDEFIDIHVDAEQLVGQEPAEAEVPGHTDSEEDGDRGIVMAEPVRGRVMRAESSSSSSGSGEDRMSHAEQEETSGEASEDGSPVYHPPEDEDGSPVYQPTSPVYQPAEYPDGMGSTADDIIEGMTTFQEQLEGRIHQLEGENQVHQDREDQYRDLAYQTLGERDELTQRLAERDSRIALLEGQLHQMQQAGHADGMAGSLVHRLVSRGSELRRRLEQAELEMAGLVETHEALGARLDTEIAGRVWAERRAIRLETEVLERDSRIDSLSLALTSSMSRLRHRVRRYPQEEGSSRRVLSRRVVDRMARRELRRAVRYSRWY